MASETEPEAAGPRIEIVGVSKAYGGAQALSDVSFSVRSGEVHALLGENGAGKSTLVKILTGFHQPDAGRLYLDGKEVRLRSVQDARRHGIETVFQDLALVDELSVYHNLFLNREHTRGGRLLVLRNRSMRAAARQYLDEIEVDIPSIDVPAAQLSGGQRQAIAIARATRQENVKILILDEPLAAMGAKESSVIIEFLRRLCQRTDISLIVIDHNYTHLFELCDRVNVIQEGRVTLDKSLGEISMQELVELMVQSYRRQVDGSRRRNL